MKHILIALFVCILVLLPIRAHAQDIATEVSPAQVEAWQTQTAVDSLAMTASEASSATAVAMGSTTVPSDTGGVNVTINEQPAPTPASATSDGLIQLAGYVGIIFGVVALVILLVRAHNDAERAAAILKAQENREFVGGLETRYQVAPASTQEAIDALKTLLRLANGLLPSKSLVALANLIDDIQTPGIPPEFHQQVQTNAADISELKAQMEVMSSKLAGSN